MKELTVRGLPILCGNETEITAAMKQGNAEKLFLHRRHMYNPSLISAAGIILHMHQPLIPVMGDNKTIISNLVSMLSHPDEGDNHDAPQFIECYRRMGTIIPECIQQRQNPRVMLDYSGTLLYGLQKMKEESVLDALKHITVNEDYYSNVEWLGSPWGHAVAPSTPARDYRFHVRAWQHSFASLFGVESLQRVHGFSPSEMALPNDPDAAYDFVSTLKECGYQWIIVQEDTVESDDTGQRSDTPHIPHRLECRNSSGSTVSITALIKTQGSDTKLIGQMQPYYEAKGVSPIVLKGVEIPQLVVQIGDGENGGVMMNEFPGKYREVVQESSGSSTPLMNISEYLELLSSLGIEEDDFPVIHPLFHQKIFARAKQEEIPIKSAISLLSKELPEFHSEGGSWTNDRSWVAGYDSVLNPMEEASRLFRLYVDTEESDVHRYEYQAVLFHLLCAETSCFRYWGEGVWTEYGKELSRRTIELIENEFRR